MKGTVYRKGLTSFFLAAAIQFAPDALAQNPPWQISVSSEGASGVTIGSNNGYGGVTDYYVYDIPHLTQVNLQAPLTSGGKNFYQWQGCTSTAGPSGSTCSVTMTYDWSVAAVYVDGYQLNVNSSGVSGVAISSTTGHGGTTHYSLVLSPYTGVSLQAPVDLGSYVFFGWSGCDSTDATTCNLNMSSHKTVTASYVFVGSPADDFVTTWRTDNPGPTSNTSIYVPMVGGPYLVDWNNDGTFDEYFSDGSALHNFGVAGTYTIRIWGSYDAIRFDYAGDKEKILSVDQWGTHPWASMSDAFSGAANLTVPATDIPDFSALTDLSNMFFQAASANPDTSGWNTSSVTNMSSMFNNATAANPDTSGWDTSSVTNMKYMFSNAHSADPDTSGWNTSAVTDMSAMFAFASSANPDTSGWNTSSVTNMSSMFYSASTANPDTSGWNTSSVTNMSSMFRNTKVANPDTSGWDTSAVIDMSGMFFRADAANPDTSGWVTTAVTDMSTMFWGADIASPNTSSWDTSNVTDMSGMFVVAYAANPDTSGWNTSSVTDMSAMFASAYAANPDTSGWDTSNVTQMAQMFENASAFDRDVGTWNVTALVDATDMFEGIALSIAHYESLLTGWNAQPLQSGVSFGAGNSHYCSAAAVAARTNMMSSDGWVITDGGQACPPPNPTQAPDLTPETDTGPSDTDDITWNRTPSFFVECFAPGDIATLYTDNPSTDTVIGTHDCAAAGTETITATTVLAAGLHHITYTLTNIVAESLQSPALSVTTTSVPGSPADDFVTTWDSRRSGGGQSTDIVVPMIGGPYNVDWDNDGTFDQFGITGYVYHDFATGGVYTIRIRGQYDAFRFPQYALGIRELISVDQWGNGQWQSMEWTFRDALNLVVNTTDAPDLSAVTSMEGMFDNAPLANPDTSGWGTSNVTNMRDLFRDATSADPDTSGWDTSSVKIMSNMFEGAAVANPDTSGWDTSSVLTMAYMFQGATSANPDTSGWNTSSVIHMQSMFEGATSANPDTSGWNTSSVLDMSRMFTNAAAANPDTNGWDTSSVKTMSHMFEGAALANPDTSGWNTSSVNNLSYMFLNATSANPDTSVWDTSSASLMHYMFWGATSANPDVSGWNTTNVTNMSGMFANATAFDRDIGPWDVTALTDATGMFEGITLSTANYDSLLIGWEGQAVQPGVTFSGGNSTYCSRAAINARSNMISSDGWTITDGGKVCPPMEGLTLFVPIQPCRILDTRVTGGRFGGGTTRSYRVLGDGLDLQGGSYECGVPADAVSVQLNFTAVAPTGFGYLRAWPYDLTEPTATLMAFTAGPGISNSVALPICNDCVSDFSIKIYGAATHLAVEVLGYYREVVAN